jgi:hypothetical protein
MSVPVKLQDLIDALELVSDSFSSWLNRDTGEVCTVSVEAYQAAEEDDELAEQRADWEQEEIALAREIMASDRYLALPGSWEVHEWGIMRDFCNTLEDDRVYNRFLGAIEGRGAFRRFKDLLSEQGMWDRWNDFRHRALREIVVEWCEAHGVHFRE